jgi:hypothetical protein
VETGRRVFAGALRRCAGWPCAGPVEWGPADSGVVVESLGALPRYTPTVLADDLSEISERWQEIAQCFQSSDGSGAADRRFVAGEARVPLDE